MILLLLQAQFGDKGLYGSHAGAGFGETLGFVWSTSSDKHLGQHDVQQEVGSTQRICRETKQRPRPQTTGPQTQDKGIITSKILTTWLLYLLINDHLRVTSLQCLNSVT